MYIFLIDSSRFFPTGSVLSNPTIVSVVVADVDIADVGVADVGVADVGVDDVGDVDVGDVGVIDAELNGDVDPMFVNIS